MMPTGSGGKVHMAFTFLFLQTQFFIRAVT